MKKSTFLLIFSLIVFPLLLATPSVFSQRVIGVFLERYDPSSFEGERKYMGVGISNKIFSTYNGSSEFLEVKTNNGNVEGCSTEEIEYCIIPEKPGKVRVTTITKIWQPKNWDTVKTDNTFIAVKIPDIVVQVNTQLLKDSLTISYSFVDSRTKKMNKRYQLGSFPAAIIIYSQEKEELTKVNSFTEKNEYAEFILPGNVIFFPPFSIRDKNTEIIFFTKEFYFSIP